MTKIRPDSQSSVRDKVQALHQRSQNSYRDYAQHQVNESESSSSVSIPHSNDNSQIQVDPSPSWRSQFLQNVKPLPLRPYPQTPARHSRSGSVSSDMITEPSLQPSTPVSSSHMSEYTLRNSHSFPLEQIHVTSLRAPHSRPFYKAPMSASEAEFSFPRFAEEEERNVRTRSRTVSTFSDILNGTGNRPGSSASATEEETRADQELLESDTGKLKEPSSHRRSNSAFSTTKGGLLTVALKPTISATSSSGKASLYTLTSSSELDLDDPEFARPSVAHPTTRWGVPKRFVFLLLWLYFTGVTLAILNHFLFAYLHNRTYGPLHPFNSIIAPVWVTRLAIFLPLLVTCCFNSVTSLCLGQLAWYISRRPRDGISIRGLDALFSLSRDVRSPFRLVSCLRDVSFFTMSASMIAVAGWFIPLIVVCVPTTLSHAEKWRYDPLALVVSYGSATFIATITLIVGLCSAKSNGVVQETGFAAFLCATRNRELDNVLRGYGMGGVGIRSSTAGKVRLLFGEIEKQERPATSHSNRDVEMGLGGANATGRGSVAGERHVAFGLVGRVMGVEKGGPYS